MDTTCGDIVKRIELNSTESKSRDMTYKIINDNCQSENKLNKL